MTAGGCCPRSPARAIKPDSNGQQPSDEPGNDEISKKACVWPSHAQPRRCGPRLVSCHCTGVHAWVSCAAAKHCRAAQLQAIFKNTLVSAVRKLYCGRFVLIGDRVHIARGSVRGQHLPLPDAQSGRSKQGGQPQQRIPQPNTMLMHSERNACVYRELGVI